MRRDGWGKGREDYRVSLARYEGRRVGEYVLPLRMDLKAFLPFLHISDTDSFIPL